MTALARDQCGCGQRVMWARTERNRWIPLDPKPNPDGNQAAWEDGDGTWRTRQLGVDDKPWDFERVFTPHAATCTGRRPAPEPAPLPANVISLAEQRNRLKAKAKQS